MSDVKNNLDKSYEYQGDGYILFYKFDEEFVRKETFLPDVLKNNYCGGLGAVIYMNYLKSEIGPYEELLFIPGKFYYRGQKHHFISKAYASKKEAAKFGYGNLSMEEEAAFTREELEKNKENITTYINGEDIASFELKSGKIKFKVGTSNFFSFSLMRLDGEEPVKLKYSGNVTAKFTKLESIKIRPAFFPDVASFKPLVIFKMKNFTLRFPKTKTEKK